MTWREKTVIAILLLVAKIIAPEWREEIQKLANHIAVHAPKDGEDG